MVYLSGFSSLVLLVFLCFIAYWCGICLIDFTFVQAHVNSIKKSNCWINCVVRLQSNCLLPCRHDYNFVYPHVRWCLSVCLWPYQCTIHMVQYVTLKQGVSSRHNLISRHSRWGSYLLQCRFGLLGLFFYVLVLFSHFLHTFYRNCV